MELSTTTIERIIDRFDWESCPEYGEPGYGDHRTTMVVLGDYWLRPGNRLWRDELDPGWQDKPNPYGLAAIDRRLPRLFAQLEAQGVEFVWRDEWIVDWDNGGKAYRTTSDRYSWTPSYVLTDDCGMLTRDDDFETWLDWAINSTDRPLIDTFTPNMTADLAAAGFERQEPRLEHGWYPGQDDTPEKALEAAKRWRDDDFDFVFTIDGVSQFDMAFSLWLRPGRQEEQA